MKEPKIAYFCAEIGIGNDIKTYSGGLGILAGDTIKAMADLNVPFCGVTLLYKKGFLKQTINQNNNQEEHDEEWNFSSILNDTEVTTSIVMYDTQITIKIWKYVYKSDTGSKVPVYFLDVDLDENPKWARELTQKLYQGDRMLQELILGLGGYEALRALSHTSIEKYHMNEGHSAFLTLKLYRELGKEYGYSDEQVQNHCVFTTHTPIPAGHDTFEYEEFYKALKNQEHLIPWHIKQLAGEEKLNMTKLALSLSGFTNAVSKKHKEVTKQMFPESTIHAITNGIHVKSWISEELAEVFDRYIPEWRANSSRLEEVFKIPNSEIFKAHRASKEKLIKYVNENSVVDSKMDSNVLTIGFARRFIQYKDAELVFENLDELKQLGGKVQFIFSGKSHKNDTIGKEIMHRIIQYAKELSDTISIAFIENYNIDIAKLLVHGSDVWLNTPHPPNEASGTSGMKASVNGCLHFSRLDGWAIEGFERNGGGFPIVCYDDFLSTLNYKILPTYYSKNKSSWIEEMKLSIGNSGSYFNTQRMAKEYLEKAYKL